MFVGSNLGLFFFECVSFLNMSSMYANLLHISKSGPSSDICISKNTNSQLVVVNNVLYFSSNKWEEYTFDSNNIVPLFFPRVWLQNHAKPPVLYDLINHQSAHNRSQAWKTCGRRPVEGRPISIATATSAGTMGWIGMGWAPKMVFFLATVWTDLLEVLFKSWKFIW